MLCITILPSQNFVLSSGAVLPDNDKDVALRHRAEIAETINYERSRPVNNPREVARELVFLGESCILWLHNNGL